MSAQLGFWALAADEPDRPAVVTAGGTEVPAGALLAAANRLVHGLRAAGVGPGDAVAAVLPNGLPMLEVYLAALQAGWYLVPVNHHLTGPEIAYILDDCGARALVTDARVADGAAAAVEALGRPPARFAVGAVAGFRPYAELSAGGPDTTPDERAAGTVMNYTSGTTGRPKGVRRRLPAMAPESAAMVFASILYLFRLQPGDGNVHLVASPLYHTAPLLFAGASLHLGHTVVVMDEWTPEATLAAIERHRVTHTHMVPTQFHRLLALPDEVKRRYDTSSLRHVVHAAAPCPVEVKRRMIEWWGPVVDEYYAASEGGGTVVSAEEWLARPGTVGRAWPGSEVAVLDDEGQPLGPGEVGTVYLHMAVSDFEYHNDPDKTRRDRVGRFFTVGDVGWLDEDGWLFLCDRKADVIITGGVNVYPAEVEGVLLTHPAVGDAAVIGVPDDEWGEQVKAVVEPAAGVVPGPALAAEILAWCGGRLARYKTPRSVDFVAEVPRDPNGKLYRRRLRDPHWAGRDRSI